MLSSLSSILALDANVIWQKILYQLTVNAGLMLPLIGALHVALHGMLVRSFKIFLFGFILALMIILLFRPFILLLPNLSAASFAEIKNADLSEMLFYIKTLDLVHISKKQILLWSIFSTLYLGGVLLLFLLSRKLQFSLKPRTLTTILSSLLIIPALTTTSYFAYAGFLAAGELKKKIERNIEPATKFMKVSSSEVRGLNVFVYVGEATSRMHWGLYGYPRNTTPELDRWLNNGLITFKQIYSTHTHTIPSLLDAFTLGVEQHDKITEGKNNLETKRITIFNILNQAGVSTHIYSNHSKGGAWGSVSSKLFGDASTTKFASETPLNEGTFELDEKTFDADFLALALKDLRTQEVHSNDLFIFHSYAGHGPYLEQIPKNYRSTVDDFYSKLSAEAVFGASSGNALIRHLEHYDSAMRYVSSNLSTTFSEVEKLKKPTIVIYFSDHGESPLTGRGHDSSRFVWEMTAVPFVIFFNSAAQQKFQDKYRKYFEIADFGLAESLANTPNLLIDLFQVKTFLQKEKGSVRKNCDFGTDDCSHFLKSNLNDEMNLPIISNGVETKSHAQLTDRASEIDIMSKATDRRNIGSKICFHRSNSLASVIRALAVTGCLETDVVISGDEAKVFHPPVSEPAFPLEKIFLASIKKKSTIWIDAKNVDSAQNCQTLYEIILNNRGVLTDVFVEFPTSAAEKLNQLAPCIKRMVKNGIFTSYYVPTNLAVECSRELSLNDIKLSHCGKLEEVLTAVTKSNLFTDLSYDYRGLEAVEYLSLVHSMSHSVWGIGDDTIKRLPRNKFRLVIPSGEDQNYN